MVDRSRSRGCSIDRLRLSEYNYSAPGRYRGVGGILTGSMGALQGWGVIWRFAYSHNRDDLFQPGRLDYFNMVSDPLSQAAERASICLFLRGDMQPAPRSLAIAMTPKDLAQPPGTDSESRAGLALGRLGDARRHACGR